MTQLNPLWMQALTYAARLDRQLIKQTWTEGVIDGCRAVQRASGGPNMSVDIGIGVSVIYGDDQTDQGAYMQTITAVENVVISAAPGSNSRRDLIYQRVNDPNAGGPAGSNAPFGVVTGTASATPTLPALPTSAIPIAEVLVTAGNVQVVDSMITSLRVPSWMKGTNAPGVGVPFFGPEALVPTDHVIFNGQALNKITDWRLYYFLGDTYGSTSTTFNTPDLRGRAPFGLDNMGGSDAGRLDNTRIPNTLGGTGGAEVVTLTDAEAGLTSHTHTMNHDHPSAPVTAGGLPEKLSYYSEGRTGGVDTGSNVLDYAGTDLVVDVPNFNGSTGPASAGRTGHQNMPPYILCNWIARR